MKKTLLILVSIALIFPMVMLVGLSLFSYYRYPLLLPENFTTRFWVSLFFNNPSFYGSLGTSVFVGALNGIFASLVGFMTARALVHYDFIFKKSVGILFSIPLFIPSMALFMGVHSVMIEMNLLNSMTAVVLAHMLVSVPYTTSIFLSFLKGINPDLENSARTMGCSTKMIYMKILFPLLGPGIYLAFSISFLISFSEYFSTFLIGGGQVNTLSFLLFPYISNGDSGNGAAIGLVFIFVNMLVFFTADLLLRNKNKIQPYLYE